MVDAVLTRFAERVVPRLAHLRMLAELVVARLATAVLVGAARADAQP